MSTKTTASAKPEETPQGLILLGAFSLTVFTLMFWAFTGSLGWGFAIGWMFVLFLTASHND